MRSKTYRLPVLLLATTMMLTMAPAAAFADDTTTAVTDMTPASTSENSISGNTVSANTYTVTLPENQEGYRLTADKTSVNANESVVLTFALSEGYKKADNFAIKTNGTVLTLNEQNQATVTDIRDNVTLSVSGVEKSVPDTAAPTVIGIENGGSYYGDTAFTVSGNGAITVLLDTKELSAKDSRYLIPADNEKHMIVVSGENGPAVTLEVTVYKIYTVTYTADGTVIDTQRVNHNADAAAPKIPEKTGYTQTAPVWDRDGKRITADTEIKAVYTINRYAVALPSKQTGYQLTADKTSVDYNGSVTFTFSLSNGYTKSNSFVIKVNGKTYKLNNNRFTVSNVTENLDVTVSGVSKTASATRTPSKSNTTKTNSNNSSAAKINSPATGDEAPLLLWSLLSVAAIGSIASVWGRFRRTHSDQ